MGNYIVDFYCYQEQLAVELAGADHFTSVGYAADKAREAYLNSLRIKLIRFENKEVFHAIEGVLARIQACFTTPNPSCKEGNFGQGVYAKRS